MLLVDHGVRQIDDAVDNHEFRIDIRRPPLHGRCPYEGHRDNRVEAAAKLRMACSPWHVSHRLEIAIFDAGLDLNFSAPC